MSFRNQYSGSPWQQGGPPFGVGSYNQNYGGYNDQFSHQMMNSGYNRNQGYGGMYGSGGMGQMRNMGYGGQSRHYMNDRMGGRSLPRGQMQRKRLPQRSPASGPRSKRPNLESDRRMAKPRRRRDSRGGSKGRSHERSDEEEEDDTYNPEEPTDDLSDVDGDVFEIWKSSDEDGEKKANGETEEKTDETSEADDETPKKPLICYVCKVTCSTRERLTKHQSSKSHTSKIDELLAIRREKKQGDGDDKKDKGSDQDHKKQRKPGNWCTVCECAFNGNFLAHRRTKEHRKKRDKKYPKCRPCRLGFSSSEEYRDHYKSEEHKQKSAEFHYLKNLASGSDDDEAAIQPVKIEDEPEDETEVQMEEETTEEAVKTEEEEKLNTEEGDSESQEKTDETKDDTAKKEKKADAEKEEAKKKPREPKAVGQSFVVSVQGYYCKLCHKFFKDVTVAKSKHCRSIMHTETFKKAMEDAVEQEEDRQRVAEEQDKIDKEAQEAAELAAEIASIERAAKEAAKKEAAEKKAGSQKEQDVEMKDVSEDSSVKEDVAAVKDDAKMESSTEKVDENGVKEDEPIAESVADKQDAEEKQSKDDKAEEEADDEPEEAKEEVSSSPATRRGRGRGRGRKRR